MLFLDNVYVIVKYRFFYIHICGVFDNSVCYYNTVSSGIEYGYELVWTEVKGN